MKFGLSPRSKNKIDNTKIENIKKSSVHTGAIGPESMILYTAGGSMRTTTSGQNRNALSTNSDMSKTQESKQKTIEYKEFEQDL